MGLTGAMHVGRSGLSAAQLAIQITGNNLANVASPSHSRQVPVLGSVPAARQAGLLIGRGVAMRDVQRVADAALLDRLRTSIAAEAHAREQQTSFDQLEAALNELSDQGLSSELNAFFGAFSEEANLLSSPAVVVQQGQQLAESIRRLFDQLLAERARIDAELASAADVADRLLNDVAAINRQIAAAEASGATAGSLRDQRDAILAELSELLDISVIEHASGSVDVLVGSTPVVLAGVSRGVELRRETVADTLELSLRVKADGQRLAVQTGRIGGLLDARTGPIDGTIDVLDQIARNLIFEVNRRHSTGTNASGLTELTASVAVAQPDQTRPINDIANASFGALPFQVSHGSFLAHVRSASTGAVHSVRIDVNLDGIGTDTTADDVRAQLDAIDGLSASWTADGRLHIAADAGFDFSFSDDSSNLLAVLGVNGFFQGQGAADIAVDDGLLAAPTRLATGRIVDDTFVENGTALAIVDLQFTTLDSLEGASISSAWAAEVQRIGVQAAGAARALDAASIIRESLEAQRTAISGVSIDEESINLLAFQQMYQASARFVDVVDELTRTLLELV